MAVKDVAAVLIKDRKSSPPEATSMDVPRDVYRWAMEQADHVRAGRLHLLDTAPLADEIEDVARREYEALVSDLSIVLAHMLKWDIQDTHRSRSWQDSISEHRERIADRLADSPSLKARLAEASERAYRYGRKQASRETTMALRPFAAACPYSWDDIMSREFMLTGDRE